MQFGGLGPITRVDEETGKKGGKIKAPRKAKTCKE